MTITLRGWESFKSNVERDVEGGQGHPVEEKANQESKSENSCNQDFSIENGNSDSFAFLNDDKKEDGDDQASKAIPKITNKTEPKKQKLDRFVNRNQVIPNNFLSNKKSIRFVSPGEQNPTKFQNRRGLRYRVNNHQEREKKQGIDQSLDELVPD